MGILRVIAQNVAQGRVTVRLPGRVPPPAGYRGRVTIDPSRCLACGVCAYVCVTGAVTGQNDTSAYLWSYEPGRCTFCGRCVDHCAGIALSMESEPLPPYASPGELAERRAVPLPACAQCGAPSRPVTPQLIDLAFGHASDDTRELLRLCERCRRRTLQRRLATAVRA